MSEAKKKAEEIVEKFKEYAFQWDEKDIKCAKKCALIHVEGIVESTEGYETKPLNIKCFNIFWTRVKEEIEKL